jgi:hypothetical protein
MRSAIIDWFSEWPDASHQYDRRPPLAVWLIMTVLACAGAWALVVDPGNVARALLAPVALAPIVLTGIVLCKWAFEDNAKGLALLVAVGLVAAAGAASLLAPSLHASSDASRRWLTAFSLLNLLFGAYLHGRAWALLLWYVELGQMIRLTMDSVTATRAAPRNDRDFVALVTSVQGDRIQLELQDGDGPRAAIAAPSALQRRVSAGARYLVSGAQLAEERVADEGGGYRRNRLELRLLSVDKCEFAGFEGHGFSFAAEIGVSVAMLVLQHVVLGLGAALLGPHL